MSLRELQQDFLQSFLDQETPPSFLKNIQKGPELSERERLVIYQESITECLANTLRETYPVCEKLVGDDFFTAMAYAYIEKTPSTSANLFDYGYSFAEFVTDFKPVKSLPYLSDICRLEWAWQRAYYAPDPQTIDFNALAHINDTLQNNIVFTLPLGSTLLKSDYPIHRIWKANQEPPQHNATVHLEEGGEHLLLWRKNLDIRIDDLTEDEWQLLTAMDRKIKLGELCEQNEMASDVIALLPKCMERGWIAGFEIE